MKLWHWSRIKNFGDALNPILFRNLISEKIESTNDILDADIILIGSVLGSYQGKLFFPKYFRKKLIVAGAGFREPPVYKQLKRRMDFQILRGTKTRDTLQQLGHSIPVDIQFGDPGLLASMLIDETKISKKYKLGVMPHFRDYSDSNIDKILKSVDDTIFISPFDDPLIVIKKIAECECLLSSAMHGLIAADSLGIPNMWAENKNKKDTEPHFKYHDYYSIYNNVKIETPIQFADFVDVDLIKDNYQININEVKQIQKRLYSKLQSIQIDI